MKLKKLFQQDDAVTSPSNMDVDDKATDLSEDSTEAGDDSATGRVSKQKMVLPAERERHQFKVAAGGGEGKPMGDVLTTVVAVITSLLILDNILYF